ncbi:MAG: hypothetical protein Tsb002_36180 [Wenzhouxiangellaceae bacterium]
MIQVLALLLLMLAGPAWADCEPIDHAPVRIDRPGSYCLVTDLAVEIDSGAAITIAAPNVDLDLNRHTLSNYVAESGYCLNGYVELPTVGIAAGDQRNVRVHNGTVQCFQTGVSLNSSPQCRLCGDGYRVEDMRIHNVHLHGVYIEGNHAIVQRNHIFDISGQVEGRVATGIVMLGYRNVVLDNDVMAIKGRDSTGINTALGSVTVVNNRVLGAMFGLRLFGSSDVTYRDNITAEVAIPYSGQGLDIGNNH